MKRFNTLIKLSIFSVLLYSVYIKSKVPTITEGFTGNIREKFRPSIRKYRLFLESVHKKIFDKIQNMLLKKNK